MCKTFSETYPTQASIEGENARWLERHYLEKSKRMALDVDRIDAARLAAERLCDHMMIWGTWNVYVDSVGSVVSEAVQVPGELPVPSHSPDAA